MASSDGNRILELDGLRGVAIGLVLLFHYFFWTLGPTPGSPLAYVLAVGRLTWTGVDLFFVLYWVSDWRHSARRTWVIELF
jgi:peptidoglycan/LPS O-acetylase OafA/YrhL